MIQDNNYINIQGWMVTKLGLSGNDLLVYAIIYGFCQDGVSTFKGSRQYLADWCNCTVRGIQKNLNNLMEKGLIKQTLHSKDNRYVEYSIIDTNEQSSLGVVNKVPKPSEQSSPYTLVDNLEKENNTISKDIVSETEPKEKKPNLYQKCLALIEEFTDDEETRSLLDTYLRMRLAMKDKPMYGVNQWKGLINKLKVLEGDVKEIIRYSTERGYASFYVPTQYQSNSGARPNRAIFGENEDNKSEKVTKEEIENGYFSGVSF